MESFTLEPTSKIDFRCSTITAHLKGLQRKYHVSEQLWNSIPNSCSSQCQGALFIGWGAKWATAEICTDAVRTVNLGRPDWQQRDRIFQKFRWKFFLFKSRVWTVRHWRPNGRTSAASNFHIRLYASGPKGDKRPDGNSSTHNFHICNASVRTIRGSRPDGWSRINNFHISCTRVRIKADWRPDGDIWIAILTLRRHASERETTLSGRLIDLPFLGTWKESETGWVLRGVWTCCWNVWTDASWNRCFSIQWRVQTEGTRRPDGWCWSVWRPDGMTRRSDG